jgi:hypothetical protein
LSFPDLRETIRSTLDDLTYTRLEALGLKDWPEVRLNPSLILFLSILLYLLEVSEREVNACKEGNQPLPDRTIKQIVDLNESLIARVDGLVALVRQSLDIPLEIGTLVRDAFRIFSVQAQFILLTWPRLATMSLGSLVPLRRLPEDVRKKLQQKAFAAIVIPNMVRRNPEYWPRIVHEVAHNVDTIAHLTDSILAEHQPVVRGPLVQELSLRSLCRERVADLLSVHAYGTSFAQSSWMILLRGETRPFPTHPAGTKRLSAIAEELETMRFKVSSKKLRERVKELEDKGIGQMLESTDLTPELQNELKSRARKFCSDMKLEITPEMVFDIQSRVAQHIVFDGEKDRFVKLTPCESDVRLVFALCEKFASENKGYESKYLHGWIRESVRLNRHEVSELPQNFYSLT